MRVQRDADANEVVGAEQPMILLAGEQGRAGSLIQLEPVLSGPS